MIWTPHTTVAAIVEHEGTFLMVEEESDGKIVYNQPAGHLDEDENLIQAAIRETLEETAWHIRITGLIGLYQWRSLENGITYLRFCFAGECQQHEAQRALDEGILRAAWMSREELVAEQEKLRSPMVLRCIDDYLAGKRYPLGLITEMNDLHDD